MDNSIYLFKFFLLSSLNFSTHLRTEPRSQLHQRIVPVDRSRYWAAASLFSNTFHVIKKNRRILRKKNEIEKCAISDGVYRKSKCCRKHDYFFKEPRFRLFWIARCAAAAAAAIDKPRSELHQRILSNWNTVDARPCLQKEINRSNLETLFSLNEYLIW